MKIAVVGFSGSGKSTLAEKLGELTGAPVLHLDKVQFLPDWKIRDLEEKQRLVEEFLDSHSSWIIDGNYTRLSHERRMEEADQIWILLFGRLTRFWRVCQVVAMRGLLAKFSQHDDLRQKLLGTGDAYLVECARSDRRWACGIGLYDDDRRDIDRWKGKNILGFALMEVRESLKARG